MTTTSNAITFQAKPFVPVKRIPEIYPGAFSESAIRWLIFNENKNGFKRCVRRIGKKVLIDLEQFELWINEQVQGASK